MFRNMAQSFQEYFALTSPDRPTSGSTFRARVRAQLEEKAAIEERGRPSMAEP